MEDEKILIRNASQVVTCSGFEAKKGKAMSDVGVIEDGAVAVSNGIITHVGPTEEVLRQVNVEDYLEVNANGRALLPGFVDSHTHFVFGGYREEEFSWRMKGDSYMSIMERGGGIVNTMNATRSTSYDDLFGDAYVDYIIEEVLPHIRAERSVTFCDVFCEQGVFSVEQSERLLKAARSQRLKLKLHADEIVPFGGAELAVRLKAVSADHLLHVPDTGIKRLARSGTIATLLPLTAFSLGEPYAPGRRMIDAGCAVALASDLNPGSCFSCSIPLLFALACIQMKMTPEEALTALTINGAAALGREKVIGSIDVGKKADLILLKFPSYKFLPYHVGMNIVDTVIKDGVLYII